jgi:hypothetical protein
MAIACQHHRNQQKNKGKIGDTLFEGNGTAGGP